MVRNSSNSANRRYLWKHSGSPGSVGDAEITLVLRANWRHRKQSESFCKWKDHTEAGPRVIGSIDRFCAGNTFLVWGAAVSLSFPFYGWYKVSILLSVDGISTQWSLMHCKKNIFIFSKMSVRRSQNWCGGRCDHRKNLKIYRDVLLNGRLFNRYLFISSVASVREVSISCSCKTLCFRTLYFRATAFGTSRSIVWLQTRRDQVYIHYACSESFICGYTARILGIRLTSSFADFLPYLFCAFLHQNVITQERRRCSKRWGVLHWREAWRVKISNFVDF